MRRKRVIPSAVAKRWPLTVRGRTREQTQSKEKLRYWILWQVKNARVTEKQAGDAMAFIHNYQLKYNGNVPTQQDMVRIFPFLSNGRVN